MINFCWSECPIATKIDLCPFAVQDKVKFLDYHPGENCPLCVADTQAQEIKKLEGQVAELVALLETTLDSNLCKDCETGDCQTGCDRDIKIKEILSKCKGENDADKTIKKEEQS